MTALPADAQFLLRFHGYDPADVEEFEVRDRSVRVRLRPKAVHVNLTLALGPNEDPGTPK